MGYYQDFLESMLCDNVMNDCEKILRECEKITREMRAHESQSKINNRDWHHRQEHCKRAYQIQQRNIMRRFHNMRSQVKS